MRLLAFFLCSTLLVTTALADDTSDGLRTLISPAAATVHPHTILGIAPNLDAESALAVVAVLEWTACRGAVNGLLAAACRRRASTWRRMRRCCAWPTPPLVEQLHHLQRFRSCGGRQAMHAVHAVIIVLEY